MSTWVKVARFHLLAEPFYYVAGPWLAAAAPFLVIWAIFLLSPAQHSAPNFIATKQSDPAALMLQIVFVTASGIFSIKRSLPLALSLGVSRRTYYTGTALLAVGLSAVFGLALALLQALDLATNGWGVGMHQFWFPWLLQGPWYLTWWTTFALLALAFSYGMWCGVVYWRWHVAGVMAFVAAQALVLAAAVVVASLRDAWPGVGQFFLSLGPGGVTVVLVLLALLILGGGYATVRRAPV